MNAMHWGVARDTITTSTPLSVDTFSGDDRKWAFVHRMLAEHDESSVRPRVNSSVSHIGDVASRLLGKAELHSIAIFCEQARCPMPKEVTNYLRVEGTNAQLASSLLTVSVGTGVISAGVAIAALGIVNFHYHANAKDNQHLVFWDAFVEGFILPLTIIAFVFFSLLIRVLLGWTGRALIMFITVTGMISMFYITVLTICYTGDLSLNHAARGGLAVLVDVMGIFVVMSILYSFFAK